MVENNTDAQNSVANNDALTSSMESAITNTAAAAVNPTFTDTLVGYDNLKGDQNTAQDFVANSSEAIINGSSPILTQTNAGQIERINFGAVNTDLANPTIADVFTLKMTPLLMVMNESTPTQGWQEGSVSFIVKKNVPDISGSGSVVLTNILRKVIRENITV